MHACMHTCNSADWMINRSTGSVQFVLFCPPASHPRPSTVAPACGLCGSAHRKGLWVRWVAVSGANRDPPPPSPWVGVSGQIETHPGLGAGLGAQSETLGLLNQPPESSVWRFLYVRCCMCGGPVRHGISGISGTSRNLYLMRSSISSGAGPGLFLTLVLSKYDPTFPWQLFSARFLAWSVREASQSR